MEHYAALKARLVQHAKHPIIGDDDDWCRDIAERLRLANRTWVDIVSARSRVGHGWYAVGTELVARAPWTGPLGRFADLAGIASLRGQHNLQNALAASAAAMQLGVAPAQVAAALATFPGLPHRLEEIGRVGRTLFINDSKATNADSAATALAAFDRDVFWILGGRPKQGGITSLVSYFPRVAKAYLIGEATEEFAATLQGKVSFERCGTLDRAVAAAARDAAASDAANRSCCCRPPAPPSITTATSRSGATPSARWWRRCRVSCSAGGAGTSANSQLAFAPKHRHSRARAARMRRYWP